MHEIFQMTKTKLPEETMKKDDASSENVASSSKHYFINIAGMRKTTICFLALLLLYEKSRTRESALLPALLGEKCNDAVLKRKTADCIQVDNEFSNLEIN